MKSAAAANSEIFQPLDDVDRMRERLAYYESFDQLIQTNVAQAGQLLREAIDMRQTAAQNADAASLEMRELRNRDLEQFRSLFSAMLDEISLLQGHAERLARRLTDAIDSLESQLPPGADFPTLASTLSPELGQGPDEPVEPVSIAAESTPPLVSFAEVPAAGEQAGDSTDQELVEQVALGSGTEVQPAEEPALAGNQALDQPESVASDAVLDLDQSEMASDPVSHPEETMDRQATESITSVLPVNLSPGQFVLLMHGVPRAATALSLKQYLEGLDQVQGVEPREFAAGVLRLQLQVSRDLSVNDLTAWPGGRELALIHARSGLLEIQMQ